MRRAPRSTRETRNPGGGPGSGARFAACPPGPRGLARRILTGNVRDRRSACGTIRQTRVIAVASVMTAPPPQAGDDGLMFPVGLVDRSENPVFESMVQSDLDCLFTPVGMEAYEA